MRLVEATSGSLSTAPGTGTAMLPVSTGAPARPKPAGHLQADVSVTLRVPDMCQGLDASGEGRLRGLDEG